MPRIRRRDIGDRLPKARVGRFVWAAGGALGIATIAVARPVTAEEAIPDLTGRGVEVAAGAWAELPRAVVRFDTSQSPADLRALAGSADWERFAADSPTAPVTVVIEPFAADGTRLAHKVHAAFTLHAPLERLQADETLRKSLGADEDAKGATARPLTAEEVREAGIPADPTGRERLVYLEIPLLNRVTIRGVVRTVTTEHPDGLEMAWQFDPRLLDHERWRATWTRREENELGARVEGEPQPYRGCGGIIAVRKVAADGGLDLLVVESRLVLGEPEAWFQGSNLLRSKIPLSAQEYARSLRRRLASIR